MEVWKERGYQQEMAAVTAAGFQVLLTAPWYLNRISYGQDWIQAYRVEPTNFTGVFWRLFTSTSLSACDNGLRHSWLRGSKLPWEDVKFVKLFIL